MNSWPVSEREPLNAPGYVKMPGRPKTERRREVHEPKNPTKMSKIGTVITCSKCKGTGHNRSTCEKRNQQGSFAPTTSQSVGAKPNMVAVLSSTQQSETSTKRKATTSLHISEISGSLGKKVMHLQPIQICTDIASMSDVF
jgi:alpha-galactosidase